MDYQLDLGLFNAVFAVPAAVVDKHLRLAGAVQLKVLLWCLRHAGEPCDSQDIAAALGGNRADVEDAMLYWREAGLLKTRAEAAVAEPAIIEKAAALSEAAPADAAAAHEKAADKEPSPPRLLSRPRKADNAFVAKRMNENKDIAFLMQEAQQILGRLINNGDSATLLMLHDDFGLPVDVIVMLLQYALAAGKANMRYIEKVGINWADEEVFTLERAEEKLRRLSESAEAWGQVQHAMGLAARAPTSAEQAFAAAWVTQWAFSPPLLREAYERCVNQTGKVNMRYINKILERWNNAGVKTLEQARQEQEQRRPAAKKSTYDIDAFERSGAFDQFDGK